MVYSSQTWLHRYLNFKRAEGEDKKDSVESLAYQIRYLTGDWYEEMTCDELQAEDREFYDEFIYMGKAADLKEGAFAETMNLVAMNDKYTMNQHLVGFGYVTDPACRESYNLPTDKDSIVIMSGLNSIPKFLTLEPDQEITHETLTF